MQAPSCFLKVLMLLVLNKMCQDVKSRFTVKPCGGWGGVSDNDNLRKTFIKLS